MTDDSNGGSFDSLSDFISTTRGVVATGQNLDEANTKAKIVTPFLRTLGWRVYDNGEVLLEYSGEEGFSDRVDYALFGPEGVYAVVEAKQIGRELGTEETQIRRYMRLFGANWGLLTNGERYLIYQSTSESGETLVESVSLDDLASSDQLPNVERQSAYTEPEDANRTSGFSQSLGGSDEDILITDSDEEKIIELSNKPNIHNQIVKSMAPSAYGSDLEKLGILLSLVGGVAKSLDNGQYIRGSIHVLIVHDPGTSIGNIAEYVTQIAPQPVVFSGKSSAETLLSTQMNPKSLSRRTSAHYSIDTLTSASHAVVNQIDKISEQGFGQIREALTAESLTNDRSSESRRQDTPGLIATSRPKYGRFDQYEPIAEQIVLKPEVVSQFDLLFAVTDRPERQEDSALANHVIDKNYAGELFTRKEATELSDIPQEELDSASEHIVPEIDTCLLRKYIAYARRNCFPIITDEAKDAIRDFYVALRSEGQDNDAPIPVTARKLEALIRLSEASARLRLSNEVEKDDAERAIDIVRTTLRGIGVDAETDEFDADVIETGTSKSQRELSDNIKIIISDIEREFDEGAPIDDVLNRACSELGLDRSKAEDEVEKLRRKGEVYEPHQNYLRTS